MAKEQTLGIIKPDAVERKHIGGILGMVEAAGFDIRGLRKLQLTRHQAESFYGVHRERPFFGELVEFMTRGPVVVLALEAEGAVKKWRDLMGATDPAKADANTIRKQFGANVGENAVHGSDSAENAKNEIAFFFAASEL